MIVQDFISILQDAAPLAYQADYDNAGLIVGEKTAPVSKVLISLDVTSEVMNEAIDCGADLIIAHHPFVFRPLKKFNNQTDIEKCTSLAIKNNVSVYACHTNLDSVEHGVNGKICEKIGLQKCRILVPKENALTKLVTYVPVSFIDKVRQAVYEAGAGCIGNYEKCGFYTQGTGSFQAKENARPFVGEINEFHEEAECRFETVFPSVMTNKVLSALKTSHPYEEVAYDLFPLKNEFQSVGDGMIGYLPEPEDTMAFLKRIKETFHCGSVKHTKILTNKVQKIAVCGGSGSFLIQDAIRAEADVFITADVKYHDFFQAENKLVIADIGHFESEQYTKELIYDLLIKKFYKFAIQISKVNTNPINYL
ncbi:MAG: Nif3-like dinuclear metal center hexameric protein [Bacteroidales bacterium]|nr:Nif3-like dinuclear metal center hexameric protein [Bacteroidales bacterium]